MKFEPGIDDRNLQTEMAYALGFIDCTMRMIAGRENIVTQLYREALSDRDLHPDGLAGDNRTRDLSANKKQSVYYFLREELDPHGFDTVLEDDHIHCEYDPKRGEVFAGDAEP